jgi:hypothetical protein
MLSMQNELYFNIKSVNNHKELVVFDVSFPVRIIQ